MFPEQLSKLNDEIWKPVAASAREAIYYRQLWQPTRMLAIHEYKALSADLLQGIIDPGIIVRENMGCGSSCGLSFFWIKNGGEIKHLLSIVRQHGQPNLKKEPDWINPNFVKMSAQRYKIVRPDITNKELAPLDKYCIFRVEPNALQSVQKTNNGGIHKKV